MTPPQPSERPERKALSEHRKTLEGVALRDLFRDDPTRGERLDHDSSTNTLIERYRKLRA